MHSNSTFPPHFLQLWFSKVADSTMDAEQTIQSLLSDSEIKRLNRIKNKNKHREYLLSRALMRHALSQHFQLPKSEWRFIEQSGSPPIINNLPENIYLSLSHSGGFVCFAIYSSPIGIDIEVVNRQRNFLALAEMFMNDEELDCLAQNESTRANHFYRIWCAKEAYYKFLPPTKQATTSLRKICFSALIESSDKWQLIEGQTKLCVFAAVTKNKPEKINHCYFLPSDKCLDSFNRFEIH
jgi:4'-phosphopantetheinyl transferase